MSGDVGGREAHSPGRRQEKIKGTEDGERQAIQQGHHIAVNT